jgi:hypothetical protein
MADYGACQADHSTIDPPKKVRFNNPTHFLPGKIFAVNRLRNLGRKEPKCHWLALRRVQSWSVVVIMG